MPDLDQLLPPGAATTALDALAATRPWERAPDDRPFVLANMVASLDGRIALDGGSTGLGGPGDKAMFHALRTVVDGLLAGTGTLRAERYGRLVRHPGRRAARAALGLAEDPVMVVVTRSGDVPFDAPLFEEPAQRVVVATAPGRVAVPPAVAADVAVVELEDPSPAAALRAARAAHGVRALLCEGGPTLNRALLDGGLLDELFLTLAPLVAGGEGDVRRIVAGPALEAPARARLLAVLRHEDELFLRYGLG
jgi:riboflavin-specific deaminase-like protein